jgi:hypothetical protein
MRTSVADISAADLRAMELIRTNLNGVDLSGTDLSLVRGRDKVRHLGPSTIGIDTIYLSQGEIPESFLRGAGVPDNFIAFARSLVGRPIEFYSCFISYSSKDQGFAERLHADLQAQHLRVWSRRKISRFGIDSRSASRNPFASMTR